MPKKLSKAKTAKTLGKPAKPRSIVKVDAPSGEDKKMQVRVAIAQRDLLAALAETRGHIGNACKMAGLSRQAYYVYLKDPDFAQAVEAVKDGIVDDYVEALNDIALNQKFFPAVKYFLDNHAQDRGFGREVKAAEQQAAKPAKVQNTQINLTQLSPEMLKQLRGALALQQPEEGEKV